MYGDGTPRPGTWQRDVWWALNRATRAGAPPGRARWRRQPPFTYEGLLVTAATVNKPYGQATGRNLERRLTHLPDTVLLAWRGGVLAGRMVVWRCGARTAYFQLGDEPAGGKCQMCLFRAGHLDAIAERELAAGAAST